MFKRNIYLYYVNQSMWHKKFVAPYFGRPYLVYDVLALAATEVGTAQLLQLHILEQLVRILHVVIFDHTAKAEQTRELWEQFDKEEDDDSDEDEDDKESQEVHPPPST